MASSTTHNTSSPSPYYVIPYDKFKSFKEIGRLGIGQTLREKLNLPPNETIIDASAREKARLCMVELFIQVGDDFIPAKDILVDMSTINKIESIAIFVSHCWLCGYDGAEGYDTRGRPHPDDPANHKFELICKGIEELQKSQFPSMDNIYIWLDFTCINQDGNPAADIENLHEIVKNCDLMLTPIYDSKDGSWNIPTYFDSYLEVYCAESFRGGEHAYLSRGWCRAEMMYSANIALHTDAASESRLDKLRCGLSFALKHNRRPHVVYGSREMRLNQPPYFLEPLQNSYFDKYSPLDGSVTNESDKIKIEELMNLLDLISSAHNVKFGWSGALDEDGKH
jgi:hypothetical protein